MNDGYGIGKQEGIGLGSEGYGLCKTLEGQVRIGKLLLLHKTS